MSHLYVHLLRSIPARQFECPAEQSFLGRSMLIFQPGTQSFYRMFRQLGARLFQLRASLLLDMRRSLQHWLLRQAFPLLLAFYDAT